MTETPEIPFAHPSERQFAELLDYYGIDWTYEPVTFVLDEDERGNTVRAVTPDFFLPDHDTFVELTTLRQPLVTKKNRKLRVLREQHPDLRLIILYRRDLERLFATHGMEIVDAA